VDVNEVNMDGARYSCASTDRNEAPTARDGSAWIAAPPSECDSMVRWVCLRRWANRWMPSRWYQRLPGQLLLHSEIDTGEVGLLCVNRMVQ
jgi:hypothetical protein